MPNHRTVPGVNASVEFEQDGALTLAPGETVEVSAVGSPGARYAMKFLLIGESLDATLDATEVTADESGRASVMLRAPNEATQFAVKVTIVDGPSAKLTVAVSAQGFGTLSIKPEYAGLRETTEWVASVVTGKTCDDLEPTFPQDPEGPPPVVSDPDAPILIEDVPVGPNLAVFVRAGHYMWGCADEGDLIANEVSEVEVPISNAPLNLGTSELDVTLDVVPDAAEWAALVDVERAAFVDMFLGRVSQESMLITAMSALYQGEPQEFASASGAWDFEGHFSTYAVDLPTIIAGFVDAGVAAEDFEITARVSGVETAPDHALLTLLSFGSATPAQLEVPAEYTTSYIANADDSIRLGGSLFWMPSRYFGRLASEEGHAQYGGHTTFAEVLAEIVHCDDLMAPGLTMCTDTCVADLCQAALGARWEEALGSSATSLAWGELPFQSSGGARFDDAAVVTGFDGTWLGELVAGDNKAKVTGDATGQDPNAPK